MARLYVQVDVNFHEDARTLDAGPSGELLFLRALALSKRLLSDGILTERQLSKLAWDLDGSPVEDLERVGLVHRVDGGWRLAGWLDWNKSADEVAEVNDTKRKGALHSHHARGLHAGNPHSECTKCRTGAGCTDDGDAQGVPETETETETNPKTVPSPDGDRAGESDADDPAPTSIDDQFNQHFWPAYPARDGKKLGKGKALTQWRKLTLEQRRRALIGARNLARSTTLPKDAHRFLRKDTAGEFPFDDWQTPTATPSDVTPPAEPSREFGSAEYAAREAEHLARLAELTGIEVA